MLFFEHVLTLNISEEDCKKAIVSREKVIDNKRRIDLHIEAANRVIPIEVKIFAGDQKEQCTDYYKVAKDSKVYYLTLCGKQPSEYSTNGLKKDENGCYQNIAAISFEKHIINWLYKCLEQKETITIAPIREVLLQFISLLKKLTGQMEVGKEMEIKKLLEKSVENIKSAFDIEKVLKVCKPDLIRKLFKELENELEKQGKKKSDVYSDEVDKTNIFYDRKGLTFPGLCYIYKENVKPNTDIVFRIEIDDRLCAGFCVKSKNDACKNMLTEKEIKTFIPHISPEIDGMWVYWEYIPIDSRDVSPDFINPNENYYNLYDEKYFKKFITDCIEKINKLFIYLDNVHIS